MIVIFDLDGTLFQAGDIVIAATKKFLSLLGLKYPKDFDPRINIGKTLDVFIESILPRELINETNTKKYVEFERAEIDKHHELFPGIKELLDFLSSNNHDMYICSNGSDRYINNVVDKAGIRDYFPDEKIKSAKLSTKTIIVSDIVNGDEMAIVIGDTAIDIKAGMDNFIPSIGCAYGYGFDNELDEALFVVQEATEIIGYIKKIIHFYDITFKLDLKNNKIIEANDVDTSSKTKLSEEYYRFLSIIGKHNYLNN